MLNNNENKGIQNLKIPDITTIEGKIEYYNQKLMSIKKIIQSTTPASLENHQKKTLTDICEKIKQLKRYHILNIMEKENIEDVLKKLDPSGKIYQNIMKKKLEDITNKEAQNKLKLEEDYKTEKEKIAKHLKNTK